MVKFNVLYKNRVEYPCKLSNLFIDVCNQVGLETGNVDFTNCNYMILGNPFTNNEDCRTVLSNIAQLAGGFAKIGRDNKVYIKTLKNISNLLNVKYVNTMTVKELNLTLVKVLSGERDNTDENIDGNNYFDDFSKNEQWGELNSLVLGLSSIEGENTALDDKTSINENGLTEITIQDNYFLTSQSEREKAIVPIWNSLKGLKYLPFKTQYYGYPYLDVGDMIYIQDTKNNGYISYVFNHTFKFNGGFSGTLDTSALTKKQTAYKNTFNIKTKFKNTERKIDKINGIIEDVIEEQTDITKKLTKHEQTIDSMKDTLKSQETKIETVETKADNAQSTADTATTKAENAQKTADANTTKITTNTTKIAEVEKTVDGITQSVSAVEEKVETVETKANNAQTSANTANTNAQKAQTTADNINTNLTTNYYNKTETENKITQTAESTISEVSKTYSTKTETATAKNEAINSANSSTDTKLKNYTVTSKLGTFFEQNYEHIKVAWNQISEFIQMMIINNNASLAILDENKNVMMALDKKGQHFYKSDGTTVFGEMGVQTVDDNNYIAFSVEGEYDNSISDGMAWGIKTKSDNKFHPLLYIKNFAMPPKNSGGTTGELELSGCNLVLSGEGAGITAGGIVINPDPTGTGLYFNDVSGGNLLSIIPENVLGEIYISFLDNITFYKNQAGSKSFKIGNGENNRCLFTDDGSIYGNLLGLGSNVYLDEDGSFTGDITFYSIPTYQGNKIVYGQSGHKYFLNWTGSQLQFWVDVTNVGTLSDKRLKTEIQDIDDDFIRAIEEIEMKQFKVANRNGLISFGILAQDLIEIFKKYGKKPFDYEIVYETQYRTDDDTIYYAINYEQFLILKQKATDKKIEQLQEKNKQKDEIIENLIKRIETLEKGVTK